MINFTQIFMRYGLVGLFLQSFLSSTIFFPGYVELLLPVFVKSFDANIVFVLTSVGSILGGLLNYGLGLAGSKLIKNKKEIIKKSKKWLEKWGDLSVFITSFLPGFPFDIIAITVGIFKMNLKDFAISMSLGKVIKYALLIYGMDFFIRIFLGI